MKKKDIFDVVGALIAKKGKFLLCQRFDHDRFGSLWEFPGGKVEKGEHKKAALKREMQEELGVQIKVGKLVNIFEDEIPALKINIFLYNCVIIKGKPRCLECQNLKWAGLAQTANLNLAPADRKIYNFLLNNVSDKH